MIRSTSTMKPPTAPRGLSRQNCHSACTRATARLGARLLFSARRSPQGAASTGLLGFRGRLVAGSRVEEGVEGVDEQVVQDHHANDDQVDGVYDRIVVLG